MSIGLGIFDPRGLKLGCSIDKVSRPYNSNSAVHYGADCYIHVIIIFIHQYMVDMQKIIMIQQTKNFNNLTKQNVCVQYSVLQRYIFQTVCM